MGSRSGSLKQHKVTVGPRGQEGSSASPARNNQKDVTKIIVRGNIDPIPVVSVGIWVIVHNKKIKGCGNGYKFRGNKLTSNRIFREEY